MIILWYASLHSRFTYVILFPNDDLMTQLNDGKGIYQEIKTKHLSLKTQEATSNVALTDKKKNNMSDKLTRAFQEIFNMHVANCTRKYRQTCDGKRCIYFFLKDLITLLKELCSYT